MKRLVMATLMAALSTHVLADTVEQIRAKLVATYPATRFGAIRTSAIPGLFEVEMGQNIAYVGNDPRYFVFGRVYDMQTQADLTAKRIEDLRKLDVSKLPLNKAIKVVRGTGALEVIVFSDPDCPFCKRLEQELQKLGDVTAYVFLMPIDGLHPEASSKAQAVWCNAKPVEAWLDLMLRGIQPAKASCPNPLADIDAIARAHGIRGTPTLFSMDGRRRDGMATAEDLKVWLKPTTPGDKK